MSASDDTLLPPSLKPPTNRISDETVLPPDSTSTLSAGVTIAGRFQLLVPLGSGGMAEVWSARDQLLNIDIAVKLPARHLAREQGFVSVLLEEARTAIRISGESRRFVGVRDIHIDPQFGPVLIMELVTWPTLRAWLDSDTPDWDKTPQGAVQIIMEMTQAVADLHQLGILHRDLKPENVFINCIDSQWHVKLVDFGLSRAIDEQTRTTVRGAMSAYYVGPEILRGQEATQASDVYALGVMFYEMLAGEKPVGRYDPLSDIIDNFPESLERVIDQCLDPKPQRRPQSAKDVLSALDGIQTELEPRRETKLQPASTVEVSKPVESFVEVVSPASAALPPVLINATQPNVIDASTTDRRNVMEQAVVHVYEPIIETANDHDTVEEWAQGRSTSNSNVSVIPIESIIVDRRLDRDYTWPLQTYKSAIGLQQRQNFVMQNRFNLLADYVGGMSHHPSGTSLIGASYVEDGIPIHSVYFSPFRIGYRPVTVEMWKEYCAATGKQMPDQPAFGWQNKHPMVNVSWNDIVGVDGRGGYCEWASNLLGMRITLPTEAQWEYCCRIDGYAEYPWGKEFDPTLLVWKGNANNHPAPADRPDRCFRTKSGVIDLIGNVWEWCLDDYLPYSSEHQENPLAIGGSEHRCLRGGSWENSGYAIRFRSAYRARALTNSRHPAYGFRLVIEHEYW